MKDPFPTLLYSSFYAPNRSVLCFSAHVCFPLSALLNPTFPLSFLLCFNVFIFFSLIAVPAFGGCEDDWFSRRNRSTNSYHKWLIEISTILNTTDRIIELGGVSLRGKRRLKKIYYSGRKTEAWNIM